MIRLKTIQKISKQNFNLLQIPISLLLGLFIIIHLFLFNINAAEWGDSYRILRASESIREFSYPDDEKRPPLYSILLALRPQNIDQVFWGRVEMFIFSVASFVLFYRLISLFFEKSAEKNLALLLFTLNPVYLYWSLRIMADVVFTFWVLLAFYILVLLQKLNDVFSTKKSNILVAALGFVSGLAVLTRFEGYILFGSVGLGLLFLSGFTKDIVQLIRSRFTQIAFFTTFFAITILPWLWYRNPFTSSYFEEPARRTYDLNVFGIYLLSFIFLFGFTSAIFFLTWNQRKNTEIIKKNIGIFSFVFIELVLILMWPAAIPRLFVPIIPFLIILLTPSILRYFNSPVQIKKTILIEAIFLTALIVVFSLGQFYYKLQFLVLIKEVFLVVVLLSVFQIYFICKKQLQPFLVLLFTSMAIWSYSTIYIHKDIFRVIQEANIYISQNLQGTIGYNDVSSVSDWYLNQKNKNDQVVGFYYDAVKKENRSLKNLANKNIDYLLITNEHNTDTTLDLIPWPHLLEVANFEKDINGKTFFTKILKVEYNK